MAILPIQEQIQGLLSEGAVTHQPGFLSNVLTSLGQGLSTAGRSGLGVADGIGISGEYLARNVQQQNAIARQAKRQELATLLDLQKQQTQQDQFDRNLALQQQNSDNQAKYQQAQLGISQQELALRAKQMAMGGEAPSAVREYQYYNSLDDAGKENFLRVKRAQQNIDLGGSFARIDPRTGLPVSLADKTLTPADLPENAAAKTAAQERAKIGAEAQGAMDKKALQAGGVLDLVQQAESLLPQATNGMAQNVLTSAQSAIGVSNERTQADKQLAVIGAGLVSNVPRMEGPQSDADVKLYRQAAGDVANPNIPTGDRLAALQQIKSLNQKYVKTPSAGGWSVEIVKPEK